MRHSTDDRYNLRFLVTTVSDTRTEAIDESGDRMMEYLHSAGRTATRCLVPNSEKIIASVLEENSSGGHYLYPHSHAGYISGFSDAGTKMRSAF